MTDRRGHHIVALESLTGTLGLSVERIDYFQTLRMLRNKDLYTGGSHITASQADEAVREANNLADELTAWLDTQQGQS